MSAPTVHATATRSKSSLKLFFEPLTLRPFVLKLLSKAFRNAKYEATFAPSLIPPSHCNSEIVIPQCGMKRAVEFPACSHNNEFLQCASNQSQQKP
jgi:hypothetical protein